MNQRVGGVAAACERLPPLPAVYAWFRSLRLLHSTEDEFMRSVCDVIEARAASEHSARLGLHRVHLDSRSELSSTKKARLAHLARDPTFRLLIANLLQTASLMQSPLYVGKARDLRARVRQHLHPMSDLSQRLQPNGVELRDCILAYSIVDASTYDDDATLTLIEEIMTRICRPGFVLRPG